MKQNYLREGCHLKLFIIHKKSYFETIFKTAFYLVPKAGLEPAWFPARF